MVEFIAIIIAFFSLFFSLYLILRKDKKDNFQDKQDIENRQKELQRLYNDTKELEKRLGE